MSKDMRLESMNAEIRKKRKFAKQICRGEMYHELYHQIAICEQLHKPLTLVQILEYSHMSVIGAMNKIRTHKLSTN